MNADLVGWRPVLNVFVFVEEEWRDFAFESDIVLW